MLLSPRSKKKQSDEMATFPSEKYAGMLERERSRPDFSSMESIAQRQPYTVRLERERSRPTFSSQESIKQHQPYTIRGALSPSSIVVNRLKEELNMKRTLSNESISTSISELRPELP